MNKVLYSITFQVHNIASFLVCLVVEREPFFGFKLWKVRNSLLYDIYNSVRMSLKLLITVIIDV